MEKTPDNPKSRQANWFEKHGYKVGDEAGTDLSLTLRQNPRLGMRMQLSMRLPMTEANGDVTA